MLQTEHQSAPRRAPLLLLLAVMGVLVGLLGMHFQTAMAGQGTFDQVASATVLELTPGPGSASLLASAPSCGEVCAPACGPAATTCLLITQEPTVVLANRAQPQNHLPEDAPAGPILPEGPVLVRGPSLLALSISRT